jgi:hypothetical protein
MTATLCHLQMNLGVPELCPGSRCAFWENGCMVEHLGLHNLDPEVSAYLLELRERLERARDEDEAAATRGEFARRLGVDI